MSTAARHALQRAGWTIVPVQRIMASSIEIPQDIIDSIIDFIGNGNDVYNIRSLKTCALVSSSFLLPSRRWLFSNIVINLDRPQACQRLLQVLVDNPVIQSFVREIWMNNPNHVESDLQLNGVLIAFLRLQFCRLEGFTIWKWNPSNWDDTNELKDALSTIIHSSTLKTLNLYHVNVPITFFQGLRLTELGISPQIEQSRLLTPAALEGVATAVIDRCVWRFGEAVHRLAEPMFFPFMCHLRVFELHVAPNSARMRNFKILSFLIRSLVISLTTPATLEHIKLCIEFEEADNFSDHESILEDIGHAAVWKHLDSMIIHPVCSRLKRVDIDIRYGFHGALILEPNETEVMEPILDALPLLQEKGILFVKATMNA